MRSILIAILVWTIAAAGTATELGWPPGPFVKFPGNPILSPRGEGFEAVGVFNPAVIRAGDTFYMLYRAEDRRGVSRIGLATSRDGLEFIRRPEPVLGPSEPYEIWGGCEDPRLVEIAGRYWLTYTAYDGHWAKLCLATSRDLVHWEKHGPIIPWPWSKSGAILARRIGDAYYMYFGDSSIWLARSPDLLHWKILPQPVLRPRPGGFDSRGVEPGPPPLLTEQGILLIYNGWDDNITYRVGAALFSRDDPARLIARTDQPLLEPTADWELRGAVPRVVFASALVEHLGRWYLYYGGADRQIGVAISEDLNR